MKVVKFKDGRYGIKRGWWLFSEYYDMSGYWNYWWNDEEYIHMYGKTSSLEQCEHIYKMLTKKQSEQNTSLQCDVINIEQEKAKIRNGL